MMFSLITSWWDFIDLKFVKHDLLLSIQEVSVSARILEKSMAGYSTVNMLHTNNYPHKQGTYLLCHKKHTHTFPFMYDPFLDFFFNTSRRHATDLILYISFILCRKGRGTPHRQSSWSCQLVHSPLTTWVVFSENNPRNSVYVVNLVNWKYIRCQTQLFTSPWIMNQNNMWSI
jgi:hypothetical protein